MKKVKIMLLSLTLVAVVGGALAFKAKSTSHFCSTFARQVGPNQFTCDDINSNIMKCTSYISQFTVAGNSGAFVCTTPDPDNHNCVAANLDCGDTPVQTLEDGQ